MVPTLMENVDMQRNKSNHLLNKCKSGILLSPMKERYRSNIQVIRYKILISCAISKSSRKMHIMKTLCLGFKNILHQNKLLIFNKLS